MSSELENNRMEEPHLNNLSNHKNAYEGDVLQDPVLGSLIPAKNSISEKDKFNQSSTQIESSAGLVDVALCRDEESTGSIEAVNCTGGYYNLKYRPISQVNSIEIPKIIRKIITSKRGSEKLYKSGFSLALKSVWFIIGRSLCLWNLDTGSVQQLTKNNTVPIEAVDFIKKPNNVQSQFKEFEYMAFIATSKNIQIFFLTVNKYMQLKTEEKIEVEKTGGRIVKIKSTADGIVFCLGEDGDFYEVDYKGWGNSIGNTIFLYKRKMRKLDAEGNLIRSIASLKKLLGKESVKLRDFVIDEARGLVYGLGVRSGVYVWKYDSAGTSFLCVASDSLDKELTRNGDTPGSEEKGKNANKEEVISLQILTEKQSSDSYLYALTDKFTRIFIGPSNKNLSVLRIRKTHHPNADKTQKINFAYGCEDVLFATRKSSVTGPLTAWISSAAARYQSHLVQSNSVPVLYNSNGNKNGNKNGTDDGENSTESTESSESPFTAMFDGISTHFRGDFKLKNGAENGENSWKLSDNGRKFGFKRSGSNCDQNYDRNCDRNNDQNNDFELISSTSENGKSERIEAFTVAEMDEPVVEISAVPEEFGIDAMAMLSYAKGETLPMAGLSEVSLSHLKAPRLFLILTRKNVKILELKSPLHILSDILNGDLRGESLTDFAEAYGDAEACAECLTMICSDSIRPSCSLGEFSWDLSKRRAFDEKVKTAAKSCFFSVFSGAPKAVEKPQSGTNKNPLASQMFKEFRFRESGRLTGLCAFFSRVVRPVWSHPLINGRCSSSSDAGSSLYGLHYSAEDISVIEKQLKSLNDFINENKQEFYTIDETSAKFDHKENYSRENLRKCLQIEVELIEGLQKLVKRSMETLSFFSYVTKSDLEFTRIFNLVNTSAKETLLKVTFKEFVISRHGSPGVGLIVDALTSIDTKAVQLLGSICPSLFDTQQKLVVEGKDLLDKAAEYYPNLDMYYKGLGASDRKMQQAVQSYTGSFPLAQICEKQKSVGNYAGALSVCLEVITCLETERKYVVEGQIKSRENSVEKLLSDLGRVRRFSFGIFGELLESPVFSKPSKSVKIEMNERMREKQLNDMRSRAVDRNDESYLKELFAFLVSEDFSEYLTSFSPRSKTLNTFIKEEAEKDYRVAKVAYAIYVKGSEFEKGMILARYWFVSENKISLKQRLSSLNKANRFFASIRKPSQKQSNFNLVSNNYKIRLKIQVKLLKLIEQQSAARPETVKSLKSRLMGPMKVYNIAKEIGSYELMLELHENSFMEDPVGNILKGFWTSLLKNEIESALEDKREEFQKSIYNLLSTLMKRYKQSAIAEIGMIVLGLETLNVMRTPSETGWVVDLLDEAGIPKLHMQKSYINIIEKNVENPIKPGAEDVVFTDFRPNFYFTKSICKVMESMWRDYENGDNAEQAQLKNAAYRLHRLWRPMMVRAEGNDQRKANIYINNRLIAVSDKFKLNRMFLSSADFT